MGLLLGVLQFIVLQLCSLWCFFLKSQSWLVYCRWNFLLGAWQGWWWGFIWWSPLSFSYPSVLVTLTIPTLWVQFLVVFNSFKQLQCLLFLGFEYKMIINYSSLMRVWKVQSNSFPFVYLSCFSHCVGMLISNLSVVMPLIGVE